MDCNTNQDPWCMREEIYHIDKNSDSNMSQDVWDKVPTNQEDLSYMFDDEATPVKHCGDLVYLENSNCNIYKEPEEYKQSSSQVKRRRMLQFDHQDVDVSISNEETLYPFLKSHERDNSLDEVFPEVSSWVTGLSGDTSLFSYENLDLSSEAWLAECFSDADINFRADDMNLSEASDLQLDVTELCNIQPEYQANTAQQRVTQATANIIFKGRKSFIRTPPKLASSVTYPFAFIKPSAMQGDVTLKEINQRIRTPPPSKSKRIEDNSASFPKSAFSGKPVVGKTKIRTEGGKGSITIMRTKG